MRTLRTDARRTPHERTQTINKFPWAERYGHALVGTRFLQTNLVRNIWARAKNYKGQTRNQIRNFPAKITPRRFCVWQIEDHYGRWSLTKHLQTRYGTWDDIDLISFRREKPLQNLPQSTIVFDNQNAIHCGWSQFGRRSVQGCHNLFPFLQDRRLIHTSAANFDEAFALKARFKAEVPLFIFTTLLGLRPTKGQRNSAKGRLFFIATLYPAESARMVNFDHHGRFGLAQLSIKDDLLETEHQTKVGRPARRKAGKVCRRTRVATYCRFTHAAPSHFSETTPEFLHSVDTRVTNPFMTFC
jgi:hypothetical protein